MDTKHDFVYDEGLNRLKWTGTEEDLRDFMQEFVEGIEEWCDGNWEEDRSHNMLTYRHLELYLSGTVVPRQYLCREKTTSN